MQSAFIAAGTQQSKAQAYAAEIVPAARGEADEALQTARGQAEADLATAKGHAEAFHALDAQYRADPAVVRERLYRDAIDSAIRHAGSVQWLPPPPGGNYHGFRITIPQGFAGSSAPSSAGSASGAGNAASEAGHGKQPPTPAMIPRLPPEGDPAPEDEP